MNVLATPDWVGLAGVALIVTGYFLLQLEKVTHDSLSYLLINLAGASGILFSLFFEWNFPAVLVEVFWIGITLFGIWKFVKKKMQAKVIE